MIVNLFPLFLQSLYSQIIFAFITNDDFRACHVPGVFAQFYH